LTCCEHSSRKILFRLMSSNTLSESDKLKLAWAVVEKSRHPQRPHSVDYLHQIFSEFEEIRGDRHFGEDSALLCGFGILKGASNKETGMKVAFVAHEKGRNTKQKIERNFGMARPEGYRKAMRLAEMAERFKLPIIAFIDTPGAFPGIGAEERGQSEAIASSILKFLEVRTPTMGVVIGEGGSGGALAIGVMDRLLMMQNSIYSVISPESCAAILWESASEAKRAAAALRLGAKDCLELGLCDDLIAEPGEGAHTSHEEAARILLDQIQKTLRELVTQDIQKLRESRLKKYRTIDARHMS
jgi:acetyl-CoA carboxylase carboxyl transferase subunit alpha